MQKISEKEATLDDAIYCVRSQLGQGECKECRLYKRRGGLDLCNDVTETILPALEEIQQYREIGTVEDLKNLPALSKALCEACELGERLVEELKEYQSIGTVEECQKAVEKMKPKKPIEYEDNYYGCPKCGNVLMYKWEKYPTILKPKSEGLPCCLNCSQAIDWSE